MQQTSFRCVLLMTFVAEALMRILSHLDPLHGGPQPLLQLGQLAPQVRIVTDQLLVNLRNTKQP